MVVRNYTWLELAREDGMTTGVSNEDGRGTGVYHLAHRAANQFLTPDDIRAACDELIGGVDNLAVAKAPFDSFGRIKRRLPKCHPIFEFPVAGVTNIVGDGAQSTGTPSIPIAYSALADSAITPEFTTYSNYNVGVEYRKRNYFLKADEVIGRGAGTYYPPSVGVGAGLGYQYAKEWERYTWTTQAPIADTVSCELAGGMKFSADGSSVDGKIFNGTPFVYLQNTAVEMMWYMVPYRYFYDHTIDGVEYKSYLRRFVNRVNQYDWNGYKAGSLLFLGATPEPFIPAVPDRFFAFGLGGLPVATSEAMPCNMKLRFLWTTRETPSPPNPADDQFLDKNIVPAGHNLMPNYVDRRFYYVHTQDSTTLVTAADQTKWKPCFDSFPVELLFTDPLLVQGGVI